MRALVCRLFRRRRHGSWPSPVVNIHVYGEMFPADVGEQVRQSLRYIEARYGEERGH